MTMQNATQASGMSRRDFLALTARGAAASAGAISLLSSLPGLAAEKTSRYNVLFIAVDDLRPELGCYGRAHMHTPNIDALARTGTVFKRAYCQQAVCSPSRTSLMTGCRPDTTRVWDLHTSFRDTIPDVVTLGQHFKNNGYFVEGVGKIYHGKLHDPKTWSVPWRYTGKVTGDLPKLPKRFRSYFSDESVGVMQRLIAEWKANGKHGHSPRGPAWDAADVPDEATGDGLNAMYMAEHLKTLKDKRQPFFMACGFYKPHLPFIAPKKYWDLYDPDKIDLADNPFAPKGAPPYALHNSGELRSYHGIPRKGLLPDDLARKLIHGYYACTSFIDACVGRILTSLQANGLAENTVVILWGDHGWQLGEHGLWCKHTNFETSTWSPLIIRVPGQAAKGVGCDALVEFVDIYPTLAQACGLQLPAHLEGKSFLPLTDNPRLAWKWAAFSQYPRSLDRTSSLMGYSMRTERYRFTAWKEWPWKRVKAKWVPRNADKSGPGRIVGIELYDHQQDPNENVNIANRAENAALVKKLTAMLEAGWKRNQGGAR